MSKFEQFTNIIENYINGNRKDAVNLIDEMGWYDFAEELTQCPMMTDEQKREMLVIVTKIKHGQCEPTGEHV